MNTKTLLLLALFNTICNSFPTDGSSSPIFRRDVERPAGIASNSVHGSALANNNGFEAAAAAAPVWLFGRIRGKSPCIPEFAIVIGSDPVRPNPGTHVPLTDEAGDDCTDPGPFNGAFSPAKPFPNYVSSTFCSGDSSWRIKYDVYYVHDGAISAGHRHDWEGATVIWKEEVQGSNWWRRDALVVTHHTGTWKRGWGDIESINNDGDLSARDGRYRAHPKVYVGYYKHPGFFDSETWLTVNAQSDDEYRSDDWFFIPQAADIHGSFEINRDWDYGDATNPSTWTSEQICNQ